MPNIRQALGANRRPEHHAHEGHRDVTGGAARATVFGISDGLVTNASLIFGLAGAHPSAGVVRLAGLAALSAGSCSMALGEYVSMQAQRELFQREIATERSAIEENPEDEHAELAELYRNRGLDAKTSDVVATALMRDTDLAVATHAREELGISPDSLGSPIAAAASSFAAFAVGAIVPLFPWLVLSGSPATIATVTVSVLLAVAIGIALAGFTGRSRLRSSLRQVLLSGSAAAIAYGVGAAVGVARPA